MLQPVLLLVADKRAKPIKENSSIISCNYNNQFTNCFSKSIHIIVVKKVVWIQVGYFRCCSSFMNVIRWFVSRIHRRRETLSFSTMNKNRNLWWLWTCLLNIHLSPRKTYRQILILELNMTKYLYIFLDQLNRKKGKESMLFLLLSNQELQWIDSINDEIVF